MKRLPTTLIVLFLPVLACGPPADRGELAAGGESPAPVADAADEWTTLVPNARRPEEGILSGGQPSAEQLAAIRDAGFRTVVNLRAEGEPGARAAEVEALGMGYVALPVAGTKGLDEDNARAFAEILATVERPAVIHCGSGNRVGALFALKAFYVDGETVDDAFVVGERAGLTRLAGAVRQHLETATDG